jgi:hypothetical protein
MHSIRASNKTSRYLPLLPLAILVASPGCGGGDGGTGGSSAGQGGIGNGTSGDGGGGASASGGTAGGAGNTAGAGTAGGGGSTAGGGTSDSGNPMSARSCDKDCAALAKTECARPDFSIATCVPQCQKAAQDGIDGARAVGCLDQYLVLDVCRANDPVCRHPDPKECVPENDAYIQCLTNAAQ